MVYAFAFMFYRCGTESVATIVHTMCRVQCGIYLWFLLLITQKCHRSVLLVVLPPPTDDGRNGNIFSLSFISDCFDFFPCKHLIRLYTGRCKCIIIIIVHNALRCVHYFSLHASL